MPRVLGSFLVALVLAAGAVRPAAAQEGVPPATPCDSLLARAEVAFFDGRFDEAIRLLTPCTAPGAAQRPPVGAYRLESMAYMNRGDAQGARETLVRLLLDYPLYEADPVQDPPAYAVLVSVVREQLEAENRLPTASPAVERRPRWRLGTVLAATAGLVVVGVAAYFAGEPTL